MPATSGSGAPKPRGGSRRAAAEPLLAGTVVRAWHRLVNRSIYGHERKEIGLLFTGRRSQADLRFYWQTFALASALTLPLGLVLSFATTSWARAVDGGAASALEFAAAALFAAPMALGAIGALLFAITLESDDPFEPSRWYGPVHDALLAGAVIGAAVIYQRLG